MARTDFMRRALAAALPIALMAASPAQAQFAGAGEIHAGTLEIPVNKSQVVTADRPIAKALVGNADIADIVALTENSIYVLGKGMGTTSLTLYDARGRVLSVMDIAVGPDAEAFRSQAARLIPGGQIDAHISGDSLVLTGLATDVGMIDRAVRLAGTYAGEKVVNMIALGSSQQVMLEVKFAEVNRSMGEEIGVRGFGIDRGGDFNSSFGPGAALRRGADGGPVFEFSEIQNSFGVFGAAFGALGIDFDVFLNALEEKGFAKTLAEPTLVALSGEKASFLAGGEFPIPVVQSSGGGGDDDNIGGRITVEFKPFGVSLGFTPTVLGDNTINLVVEPEVSQIDPAASIQISGLAIPGLQTRRASTTLELRDGESFAIAGLLQQDFQTTVNQIPLLGNIPILGALFRSTEFQKGETELLIVVTPRLVKPIRPDQVRLPTDRVRDPTAAGTVLTGEPYDPVPAAELAAPQTPVTIEEGSDYEY
ncbi:type II and III secretion system protein family protein [Qipengyuania sp. XHP0211]|uniref:type II and III secretion system protein family protein n=1 Tax=Qipengyuania sp. XHP0211 TaxID=3038079 RepID=UPI00241DCB8A|nr:type II and III secretion system protein family protein [Qipengyuania sp. XHP0211]MDG5752289.1 type II and III secretion system protein family protein [Qipengyuania sp. XHP0211]